MNLVSRWLEQRRLDRELADEMAEHLAEKIDQLRDEGHSEVEARTLAHRHFGNDVREAGEERHPQDISWCATRNVHHACRQGERRSARVSEGLVLYCGRHHPDSCSSPSLQIEWPA